MNLLEKLQATRGTLLGEPYDFTNWSMCTCGHIYQNAHGRRSWYRTQVRYSNNATYKDMLCAVLEANTGGFFRRRIPSSTFRLTIKVSDLTSEIARKRACSRHEAAIIMIDKAIEMVEKRESRAMIDVAKMAEDATAHEFPLGGD